MDKLNIDFLALRPYVIEAFTKVYGEEYRSIISLKVNNCLIVQYHDLEGLENYVSFLKRCKSSEFSIKFLEEIGIDVQKHKKENYTKTLDSEIDDLLEYYIGSAFWGFSKQADYVSPLRAFNTNNKTDSKQLLKNKLKIINYLLGSGHEEITEKNFDIFTKTREYFELLKKIEQLNLVYEELLSKYNDWAIQLQPYEQYIEREKKRKEDILAKKKREMFVDIFSKTPLSIKECLVSKTFEEKIDALLGTTNISYTSSIESFRQEQMEKLMSSDVNLWDKFLIVFYQSNYLKSLGVTIPNEEILKCNSEEDINNYLKFLNQDSIRKFIPSEEVISYISSTRKRKYEEALREYYTTRKDFLDAIGMFSNNQDNFEIIYEKIKEKKVLISGSGGYNSKIDFFSIMFYTIRIDDGGSLFFTFMHEMGHVIDQSKNGCGFESRDDFNKENFSFNPYDKTFRKYERFNEALNDIFIMEANEFLHQHNIYLIEPKEFTSLDVSNNNTSSIIKNLLQPLIQKFRPQIIKAKVNAKPEELVKYIGEENFENLVDAVNKVDYLLRNGVVSKVDDDPDNTMVFEYFEQVERVKQIYISIDDFYANNFKDLSKSNGDNFVKKR